MAARDPTLWVHWQTSVVVKAAQCEGEEEGERERVQLKCECVIEMVDRMLRRESAADV
jgi:hypothetical protein